MRAKDLKGWLAAARRGEKERETAPKDRGGDKKENAGRTKRQVKRTGRGWWN